MDAQKRREKFKELRASWRGGICGQLECDRLAFLAYFQSYEDDAEIEKVVWREFLWFVATYNSARLLCDGKEGKKTIELPEPYPELVPPRELILHWLFPEHHPHPDRIERPEPPRSSESSYEPGF